MTASRAWVVLGLSAALTACSGDDHPQPLAAELPLPECPELSTSTCDVREVACQQRLLALAGCVYGVTTTPDVPVRVVSEQQLIDELNEDEDAESDAEETADLPHIERTLVDLELLQAGDLTEGGGSTAQIVANVSGVYQDAELGIALVDRGEPQSSAEADALLLHEFVHAIQDAQLGLTSWREQYPRSVDSSLALRSVTEGQATYAQFRVLLAMTGRHVDFIDWDRTLGAFRDRVIGEAFDAPSPYFASITTFPYAFGAGSAYRSWSDHQAQFDAPPITTLQVLSRDASMPLDAPPPLNAPTPTPEGDYRRVDSEALGAFQLALSAHKLGAPVPAALDLALGWRGDALWIYAAPDQQTAWIWMIELSDASHADGLVSLASTSRNLVAAANGKRAVLTGGDAAPAFVSDAGAAFLAGP